MRRSVSLRRIWPLAILILAAACSTHHVAQPVAVLGRDRISSAELDQYTRYVVGFDSLAYPDSAEATCIKKFAGPVCDRVRREALVRLLQEHLVQRYAHAHDIRLSGDERTQVDLELTQLDAGTAPTRRLFSRHTVDKAFMLRVLARQLLVQKVQSAIAHSISLSGLEYHVRRFTIAVSGANRKDVYQKAVSATTGGPMPRSALEKTEWVAPFHLPEDIRGAVSTAHRGQYIGPFTRSHSYVIVQLLGSGTHRYGRPAREQIESQAFRRWLHAQAISTQPRCLNTLGRLARCPSSIMNMV